MGFNCEQVREAVNAFNNRQADKEALQWAEDNDLVKLGDDGRVRVTTAYYDMLDQELGINFEEV
jgi:hypothetical protein